MSRRISSRSAKGPDPQQRSLPLSRPERFGALRRIDPSELLGGSVPGKRGIGRRAWANVVDLLEQVELCGTRDGCFAYADTLADRMAGGVGVSLATLHRTRRIALACGLLTVEKRHDGRRQQSNHWSVDWTRAVVLAGDEVGTDTDAETPPDAAPKNQSVSSSDQTVSCAKPRTVNKKAACQNDMPAYQNDTPGCQSDTLYRGTASSSTSTSWSSVDRRPEKQNTKRKPPAPTEGSAAPSRHTLQKHRLPPPEANKVKKFIRAVGRPRSMRDVELGWKLVAVASKLGEAWLWNISEAVRACRPDCPWAYAWVLAREGPGAGGMVERLLARSGPPPDGWPRKPADDQTADLSERLCGAVNGAVNGED